MEALITKDRIRDEKATTFTSIGMQMHALMTELYPLCRSITGDGTRETLSRLQKHIPLVVHNVPTGTAVLDWTIPNEWNIRDAYIKNSTGDKIVDFKKSNLHVVNYSLPFHQKVSLQELTKHVHMLPDHPDWIPYRTTYYHEDWGFCVSYNQFKTWKDDTYEVFIDATLGPGHLTYGELVIKGERSEEVLISTHICHPSLCNDNLSGICVATFLAKNLQQKKLRYTYRFLFIPGTIGSITWLSLHEAQVNRIKHGLVAVLLGDSGYFTYKRSRKGNAEIDQVVQYVLEQNNILNRVKDFEPYGYDERQFCSPGFNLPVGCLTRTSYGEYPEYHTSADNLEFVKAEYLEESYRLFQNVISIIEANKRFMNTLPKGEPQLGKRGLYDSIGGNTDTKEFQMALLWVLNFSDGEHSLLDIAKQSSIKFDALVQATSMLTKAGLLIESPAW